MQYHQKMPRGMQARHIPWQQLLVSRLVPGLESLVSLSSGQSQGVRYSVGGLYTSTLHDLPVVESRLCDCSVETAH